MALKTSFVYFAGKESNSAREAFRLLNMLLLAVRGSGGVANGGGVPDPTLRLVRKAALCLRVCLLTRALGWWIPRVRPNRALRCSVGCDGGG